MDLAELTLALCRLPSETGDEAAIAAFIADFAGRHGLAAQTRRLGNALVITPDAKPGKPTIALFGHTDTVKAAGDQPLGLVDGRLYGCGASDMKGGLALMLKLLAHAGRCEAANPVLVFYDREEGPISNSSLPPLFEAGMIPGGIALALCLEPTDTLLQAGCMGGVHAHVTFHGRRAHSARPWHGDNALYRAIPFLEKLSTRERREVRVGELVFYEVITATTASTVNSRNVVPDAFTLNVNIRFAPGRSAESAIAELRELVGPDASVSVVDVAPAGAVSLDEPHLKAWRERLGLAVEAKQAWTDVAQLSERGIPAANYGPGLSAEAHQARESVPVANLETAWAALCELFGL